ncbi:hypothetical protein BH11PAT4_BH11PAT4_1510 [soil metagenome]
MNLFTKFLVSTVLVIFLSGSALAATTGQNESISPTEELSGDAYFSGTNIAIQVPVRGEFFAAGETVSLKSPVERSVTIVGSKVEVTGGVAYNSYIAGGEVILDGEFGHDVFIFASKVTLNEGAHVLGDLAIYGTEAKLAGKVDGNITGTVTTVTSSATVEGNVNLTATQLSFTGGTIAGSLRYKSAQELAGKDLVKVTGSIVRDEPIKTVYGGFALINFLSLLLFGCFVLIFLGKQTRMVLFAAYGETWRTYATGLMAIVGIPILSLLFFATILGWRVGLLLIAAYMLAMLLAGTFGAVLLGKLVMARIPSLAKLSQRKNRDLFAALCIGLLIPAVISLVPYVGPTVAALGSFIFLVVPVVGASVRLTISQSHQL